MLLTNTLEAAGGFSCSLNSKHRNWLVWLFITLSLLLWAKQQANKGPAVSFSIFCWLVWFLGVSYASVSMSCLFFSLWSITIICLSPLTPSLHQPVLRDVHFVDHVNYYLCLSFFILNAVHFLCSLLRWVSCFDFSVLLSHKQVAIIQRYSKAWVCSKEAWEECSSLFGLTASSHADCGIHQ